MSYTPMLPLNTDPSAPVVPPPVRTGSHRAALAVILTAYGLYAALVVSGLVLMSRPTSSAGFLTVDVREKGVFGRHIRVPVPAIFANVALSGATFARFDDDFRYDRDFQDWAPAIHAALEEIEQYPDMVIVEVDDHEDRVTIAKEGGRLVIHVDSDDAVVHVTVPPSTVKKLRNLVRG